MLSRYLNHLIPHCFSGQWASGSSLNCTKHWLQDKLFLGDMGIITRGFAFGGDYLLVNILLEENFWIIRVDVLSMSEIELSCKAVWRPLRYFMTEGSGCISPLHVFVSRSSWKNRVIKEEVRNISKGLQFCVNKDAASRTRKQILIDNGLYPMTSISLSFHTPLDIHQIHHPWSLN